MKPMHLALAAAAMIAPAAASAQTVSVDAQSNLYYPTGGGIAPTSVAILGGQSITFDAQGSITYNGGNFNNPDGYGSVSNENISGANGLSGISVFQAGALLGVFVNAATGTGAAPTDLSYADANAIGFASFDPLLNQVFFIGDGLTGNGTGAVQLFNAPTGATMLLLGFADAPGYNGAPGAYGDNSGTFRVTYAIAGATAGVPEPATWAMMIMGFGAVGGSLRRKRATAPAFA